MVCSTIVVFAIFCHACVLLMRLVCFNWYVLLGFTGRGGGVVCWCIIAGLGYRGLPRIGRSMAPPGGPEKGIL